MRGDEAKQVCPQIQLVQVPVARGKADLNGYRNASSEVYGIHVIEFEWFYVWVLLLKVGVIVVFLLNSQVVSILARKGRCERASIDEVYLDLTDAAETMLAEMPPESLEEIDEEALRSHVLGLNEVETMLYWFSVSSTIYSFDNGNEIDGSNMTRCEFILCKSVVIFMLEIIGKLQKLTI